ncbi:MAG: AlpA family phage regulatory protein [Nevskia sp.]|nr:AlpA family phage regulatory protein [Nevskia sp.]
MLDETIMRLSAVKKATGLSRTTIYVRSRAGTFPAPISIGGNRIGWRESEIKSWIEARSSEPDNPLKIDTPASTNKAKQKSMTGKGAAPPVEWEAVPCRRSHHAGSSRGKAGPPFVQFQGKLPFR